MTTTRHRGRAHTPDRPIIYPESDGKPLGESELHVIELLRLYATLRAAFAQEPMIWAGANMFLYFEEGNPRAVVAPDVFVVKGVAKVTSPELRRTFKLWEEGITPAVVIEVTSRSTRNEDLVKKRAIYAALGVREYYLYDPLAEYLRPALQALQLVGSAYELITPEADGAIVSVALGMRLRLVERRLRLFDATTDAPILSPEELAIAAQQQAIAAQQQVIAAQQQAIAAHERADTETVAREQAEAARDAAERRVAELLALLNQQESP